MAPCAYPLSSRLSALRPGVSRGRRRETPACEVCAFRSLSPRSRMWPTIFCMPNTTCTCNKREVREIEEPTLDLSLRLGLRAACAACVGGRGPTHVHTAPPAGGHLQLRVARVSRLLARTLTSCQDTGLYCSSACSMECVWPCPCMLRVHMHVINRRRSRCACTGDHRTCW